MRDRLTAADIGFAIAPRLNAAGRLEDMALGIECLLTDDLGQARGIAGDARRDQWRTPRCAAADDGGGRTAHWRGIAPARTRRRRGGVPVRCANGIPGVIGLVASKMKERLHRPVIAFAPAEPGSDRLRGSARSIPGFHIRDALAAVAARASRADRTVRRPCDGRRHVAAD